MECEMKYLVFNIGCIECGVESKIVGIFDDKSIAEKIAALCKRKHSWRDGGQNNFEVFEMPINENIVDEEYMNIYDEEEVNNG
jgi:hypothetical protein